MISRIVMTVISIALIGCAAKLGPVQFAIGDASVTDGSTTTTGGEIPIPGIDILKDVVGEVVDLIPGDKEGDE